MQNAIQRCMTISNHRTTSVLNSAKKTSSNRHTMIMLVCIMTMSSRSLDLDITYLPEEPSRHRPTDYQGKNPPIQDRQYQPTTIISCRNLHSLLSGRGQSDQSMLQYCRKRMLMGTIPYDEYLHKKLVLQPIDCSTSFYFFVTTISSYKDPSLTRSWQDALTCHAKH